MCWTKATFPNWPDPSTRPIVNCKIGSSIYYGLLLTPLFFGLLNSFGLFASEPTLPFMIFLMLLFDILPLVLSISWLVPKIFTTVLLIWLWPIWLDELLKSSIGLDPLTNFIFLVMLNAKLTFLILDRMQFLSLVKYYFWGLRLTLKFSDVFVGVKCSGKYCLETGFLLFGAWGVADTLMMLHRLLSLYIL